MNNEMKIKLDNATLRRGADGVITISKGGSCLTIGLLIGAAIVALVSVGFTILGVVRFFDPTSEVGIGTIGGGLALIAFSGYATYYLYSSARRGQITVVPIVDVVKVGKREIPFKDIANIDTDESAIPMMNGVVALKFLFTLTTGETIELGRIAIDQAKTEKMEKIKKDVTTLLLGTIRKN